MPVTDTVISTNTTDGLILAGAYDSLTVLASGSIVAPTALLDGSLALSQSVAVEGYVNVAQLWLGGMGDVAIGATGTFVGHADTAIILGYNPIDVVYTGGSSLLNQGTIRAAHTGIEVHASGNSIVNSGLILAGDTAITTFLDTAPTLGLGIPVEPVAGSSIVNSGSIQSTTGTTILLQDEMDSLTNSGSVISNADIAVSLAADGQYITNTGLIQGQLGALSVSGGVSYILNKGDIISQSQFVFGPTGPNHGSAIDFTSGTIAFVTNFGLIHGSFTGISSENDTPLFVTNSGTIEGVYAGVYIQTTDADESGSFIRNSGTISGLFASLILGDESDRVINTGTLSGDVGLGGGDDLIDTRHGDVLGSPVEVEDAVGAIYGGDGSDTYLIGDASILLIEDIGIDGDVDLVKSTVSYALETNFETLTLLGSRSTNGAGNAAANTINGNSGDNRLSGHAGFDHLYGNAGDDLLYGGAGYADVLYGGAGDDVLIGGAGRDWMFGGADADTFVYLAVANTGATEATSDSISDFKPGEDIIDLSRLDAIRGNGAVNDAFTFIETAAFTGVAGELHFGTSDTNTVLEFDLNGDTVADGVIRLYGTVTLSTDDFVL